MIPISAWIVLRALKWQGFDAYLVGGCVRDLLMKRTPRDFDVITTAFVDQVRKLFVDSKIVGKNHPLCEVKIDESVIEVSNVGRPLTPSLPYDWDKIDYILYSNSQKRDFTINSLFLDLFSYRIYDYNNGIEDLESRMLRTMIAARVSFKRDCARILRGVRIAARLDLSFSEEIEDAIPKRIHLVARLSSFRLTRELNFMLSYGAAVPSINLLQKLKLLHILLPFQAACLEGGEEETTKSSAMLERLFSNLDKLHSCGNPAADSLWIALLAFHMTLVLHPQRSIVVCAIASLLSCRQWDEAIEYARKHNDASPMSDEELAEAVRAFGLLVREESALLVNEGVLNPKKWEEAVDIFKLKVEDSDDQGWKPYSKTPVEVKMEIGNIILEVIKKVG